ncbi:MAG: T9SS type A sorting domain-containing protein [Crocinitomicaceae bacterium]
MSSLTPNPASNIVNVEYSALNATSASLKITNSTAPSISENFVLNCLINQSSIDISSLPAGAYTVTLICDGIVTDSKSLVIQ